MAFFDSSIECSNGVKKRVRVPSNQGGTDRTIYVNGSPSGYVMGNGNNKIYNAARTREVSTLSLVDFAKANL